MNVNVNVQPESGDGETKRKERTHCAEQNFRTSCVFPPRFFGVVVVVVSFPMVATLCHPHPDDATS